MPPALPQTLSPALPQLCALLGPNPPLISSPTVWQRIYNRADWHKFKKVNKVASAAGRSDRRTHWEALQRLVKAVVESLNPRSTSQAVLDRRTQLQRASVT